MLKVKDVMVTDLVTVKADISVKKAVKAVSYTHLTLPTN